MMARIEAFAHDEPARPAFIRDGAAVGYGELARQVRATAAQLARAGIAPGDAVGVTLEDHWAHILVSLALIRLGCRQVGLAPREPLPLRASLAQRLGLVAVVGLAAEDAPAGVALLRPDLEAIAAAREDVRGPPPIGRGEMVMATSGTTGRPKLMIADEVSLLAQAELLAGFGSVFLHVPSFDANHSRRLTFRSLFTGGTEVLAGAMPPRDLARFVARHGVGRVHLAPPALTAMQEALADTVWPRDACIVTTGTRVPQAVRRALQATLGCRLQVIYGTTEAGMVSVAGPADHESHPDSVGPVLPDVEVEVVDEAGLTLPAGAEGLLRFRSAAVVRGYLDDPEADAQFFDHGWFRPGDVGRLLPGGELLVAGRADDRMTLGVIKIFPAEIEAVAEGFPGVLDCAAFAAPSGHLGDIPMLAVVAGEGFDAAALVAHCRERLGLRAPRKVVALATLPRNAQGKVLRRELPRLAGLAHD